MSLRVFATMAVGSLVALSPVACAPAEKDATDTAAGAADTAAAAAASATRVTTIQGFSTPESVMYDSTTDMLFVSNINGSPSDRDNNGFISRVRADGTIDSLRFVAGGRSGVTLSAPKGMALAGDTLWVTDIDAIRAFNRTTGAPITSVNLRPRGAVFLNDMALGPDSAIYITDTGIRFTASGAEPVQPGRIFRVARDRSVTIAAQGDTLGGPNGIAWDRTNNRFVLGGFSTTDIFTWAPGEARPTKVATGPGGYDGLAVLNDGRVLISSWSDSTVSVVTGQSVARLVSGVDGPADFGIDTRRQRIAIPRFMANTVEIWTIPNQ
ncbi:MAG TPA: SMP-30/gluconolactonase/LRE family protein [Gemmatimonadaceae bacterium]|nr:SMP-30/gluconolactonase/LRE family protein [Gemmatimonadaceae bacterium]